jgi:molecular chaperone GrpE (heat shock protein)
MTHAPQDRVTEGKESRQEEIDRTQMDTSSAYTFNPPDKKEAYIAKLEEQVEHLKSIAETMSEKGEKLGKEARKDFEAQKEIVRKRFAAVKGKLDDMRGAGGEAWKELRRGTESAWSDLAEAVKSATAKFK